MATPDTERVSISGWSERCHSAHAGDQTVVVVHSVGGMAADSWGALPSA